MQYIFQGLTETADSTFRIAALVPHPQFLVPKMNPEAARNRILMFWPIDFNWQATLLYIREILQ